MVMKSDRWYVFGMLCLGAFGGGAAGYLISWFAGR